MSLLSSIILPLVEKQLAEVAPELTNAALIALKAVGKELVEWAETKLNVDINGDGIIGDSDGESS